MFELPQALAALGEWRQFIVFKLVPSKTRIGKTDKLPVSRQGYIVNAHDPAHWMTWPEAAALAAAFDMCKTDGVLAYGVGFVFTGAEGLWFIDIDECAEFDAAGAFTGWSPTATALMQRFAGCAIEVSASNRGLHLIGRGHAPTPRKVKYGTYFDLYTEGRFVALTGTSAMGDANTLHDTALAALVREYLLPDPNTVEVGWTSHSDPRWRGNENDDELIARAIRSSSDQQALGRRATFQQLWTRDVDALTKFYPDDHGNGFDESKADSALAQALAFWTGNNCERIYHLMQRSALKRDKWERESYVRLTIQKVVARQFDVLQDKPPQPAGTTTAAEGSPLGTTVTGDTFLTVSQQIELFKGCVYIQSRHRVLVPGGFILKPEQFRVAFGGYTYQLDAENQRVTRNAWEAFTDSQVMRSPRVEATTFRPELPPGHIVREAGLSLVNIYWPVDTLQAEGDAGPFERHMEKMFPDADDRLKLMSYLAAIVQYPGRKFQWAPLIQGVEGNGKTLINTAMVYAVGERYSHLPNMQDYAGNGAKFTGWLEQKLLVILEEIHTHERFEIMESLKPLITNARIEIQAKGADQITGDNRANIIASTNHKDAVPKTLNERRWGIFYCAQQSADDLITSGMGGNYMPDLWDWAYGRDRYAGQSPGFAIINRFLREFKIPNECNPAGEAHRAPVTTSTSEAIKLNVGAIEQEVQECIDRDEPGFSGGWVSSMALDKLLIRLNAERRIPPRKRRDVLKALGYELHPHLIDGRVPISVQPDGGKTRLYAKKGHLNMNFTEPAAIARAYQKVQNDAAATKANFGT